VSHTTVDDVVADALAADGQKIDRETIAKTTAEYKNFLILGSPC
jgi:hypothetical protein